MDPSKNRDLRQERELYALGHSISYIIEIRKLRTMLSWPLKKTYKSECPVHPTSFFLRVDFLEVREDATATLSVSLKRNDALVQGMDAYVWVQISDLNQSLIFPRQTFEKAHFFPGDELQKTVDISPLPEKRDVADEKIEIHISVMICGCHRFLDTGSDSESSVAS